MGPPIIVLSLCLLLSSDSRLSCACWQSFRRRQVWQHIYLDRLAKKRAVPESSGRSFWPRAKMRPPHPHFVKARRIVRPHHGGLVKSRPVLRKQRSVPQRHPRRTLRPRWMPHPKTPPAATGRIAGEVTLHEPLIQRACEVGGFPAESDFGARRDPAICSC